MSTEYDPTKVNVIVDGVHITGFADGSMITGSRNTDKWSQHVGVDGNVTFVKSADDTGEVTITLKHTSASNQILEQIYNEGKTVDFACVDANFEGDVGINGSECKVVRPDFERTDEVSEPEWTLLVSDYTNTFENVR